MLDLEFNLSLFFPTFYLYHTNIIHVQIKSLTTKAFGCHTSKDCGTFGLT